MRCSGSDKRDERRATGERSWDGAGAARAAGSGRSSSPRGSEESGSSTGDGGRLSADHQQIQRAHHSPAGQWETHQNSVRQMRTERDVCENSETLMRTRGDTD